MIEMRKLQKLGKVELLELVRELTEELEEVRFKNDVLIRTGTPAQAQHPLDEYSPPPYAIPSSRQSAGQQMPYQPPEEMIAPAEPVAAAPPVAEPEPMIEPVFAPRELVIEPPELAMESPPGPVAQSCPVAPATEVPERPQSVAQAPPAEPIAQEIPPPRRRQSYAHQARDATLPEILPESPEYKEEAEAPQSKNTSLSRPPREPTEEAAPEEGLILSQLEHFTQSIQEICEIALRTRRDMETCMASVQQSIKQRDEEVRQMAEMVQTAMGKSETAMKSLLDYKATTEGTLERLMESVTNLQRVIQ